METILKRAFLVGINYRGSDCELHGCINDVKDMEALLLKNGYSSENILIMTDDTLHQPTCKNIIEGWKWLLSKSKASEFGQNYINFNSTDTLKLFFHYSGHGSQVRDLNRDESDGLDETICPIDFITNGMITDDQIKNLLVDKVPIKSKLFSVIDACHSESSFDLGWSCTPTFLGDIKITKVGSYLPTIGSTIMISGCKDAQTSADVTINGKGHGALTYSLIKILEENNYKLSYKKLLLDVRSFIRSQRLSSQIPCLSFSKSLKNLDNFFEI
jgi:hypothetical protein